jgi:type VI secretion system secreted protein VgrG
MKPLTLRDGSLAIKAWPIARAPSGKLEPTGEDYFLTLELDRPVRGELALIALRVMRELGVRHGVPFDVIDDEDRRFRLPEDLQPIATQILDQALGGAEVKLDADQECLLRSRYIHQSAHWVPSKGLLINKPTENNVRNVHPNKPQMGYPQ